MRADHAKTKDYCMTQFFGLGQSILQVFETSIALSMVKSVKSQFFQTLLVPISWTLALCMLQLIRIAHPTCTTQRSESPNANTIALKNTFVKNFLSQHIFCFLNIIAIQTYYVIASTPFILCMLHVIRIAHPNVTKQCSESQKAYTITLSKIFILMKNVMLTYPNIKVKNETADTCNIMSAIILKNITPQTPTDDTDR